MKGNARNITRERQPTTQTESQTDRQTQNTHYYDRNRSRKVCQEYQTNVLSEGNRSAMIAVSANVVMTMRITHYIPHEGNRDLFTEPVPRLLTIQ